MSRFVDACRKEWKRLGVPEVVANEMAEDLEADLREAEADGVAPEEVLGNGLFDPKAFAASWADARGVVGAAPHDAVPGDKARPRPRSWTLAVGAVLCAVAALVGFALLVGHAVGSAAMAAGVPRRVFIRPTPAPFATPQRLFFVHPDPVLAFVGGLVLLAALVGEGVTLWLWKPWTIRKHRARPDPDVGMPSYL